MKEIIVRSNLTILQQKEYQDIPVFYKRNKVHLICSLPCYDAENVDAQRGNGVFKQSIQILQILNGLGYGVVPGQVVRMHSRKIIVVMNVRVISQETIM